MKDGSGGVGQSGGGSLEGWNKLTNHQLTLDQVGAGTMDEEKGFEFVAVVTDSVPHGSLSMMRDTIDGSGKCWNDFVPFSVTTDGISCQLVRCVVQIVCCAWVARLYNNNRVLK